MAEWTPTTAKPVADEWVPTTAKIPVRAHTRRYVRTKQGDVMAVEDVVPPGATMTGETIPNEAATRTLAGLAPVAGATLGASGGIPGATIGGGIGGIIQQGIHAAAGLPPPKSLIGEMTQTDPASLQGRFQQVGENAILGGAGEALGPPLRWIGKGAVRIAGRLTPESAEVAVREGIAMTRSGLRKALTRIGSLGDAAYQTALSAGPRSIGNVQAADIVHDIAPNLMDEISNLPLSGEPARANALGGISPPTGEFAKMAKMFEDFVNSHSTPMTAAKLHRIRQVSDVIAAGRWEQAAGGEWRNVTDPITQRFHEAVANWARTKLRGIEVSPGVWRGGVPGYAQIQSRLSDLIRLKDEAWQVAENSARGGATGKAVSGTPKYAIGRTIAGGVAGGGAGLGAGRYDHGNYVRDVILGSLVGALAGNPAALSHLGLLLTNPATTRTLATGVRAGAAAQQEQP
jgi:hypothetical protein